MRLEPSCTFRAVQCNSAACDWLADHLLANAFDGVDGVSGLAGHWGGRSVDGDGGKKEVWLGAKGLWDSAADAGIIFFALNSVPQGSPWMRGGGSGFILPP